MNCPTSSGVWFQEETTEQDKGANALSNAMKNLEKAEVDEFQTISKRQTLQSRHLRKSLMIRAWMSTWKTVIDTPGVCDNLTKRGKLLSKKKGTEVWWNAQLYLVIFWVDNLKDPFIPLVIGYSWGKKAWNRVSSSPDINICSAGVWPKKIFSGTH